MKIRSKTKFTKSKNYMKLSNCIGIFKKKKKIMNHNYDL